VLCLWVNADLALCLVAFVFAQLLILAGNEVDDFLESRNLELAVVSCVARDVVAECALWREVFLIPPE
jgi:hypothetical protein